MKYRHELKQLISAGEAMVLADRLRCVLSHDEHCEDGAYLISSLYFDDPRDTALKEKINGISRREKFRLRCYNGRTDTVWLEKKSKLSDLCAKQRLALTGAQAQCLLDAGGRYTPQTDSELERELAFKLRLGGLRPKTIADYRREAFVCRAGNVRVTLDSSLRCSLDTKEFLNPGRVMLPARETATVLEIKYDEFLPDIVRDLVQLENTRTEAFSKYAACRVYG